MNQLPVLSDGTVRLRPATMEDVAVAEEWYRDPEVLKYSEGTEKPYDRDQVKKMYSYLMQSGHFFIIEVQRMGGWTPVGDVCLMENSLPIVIGDRRFRSSGYGKRVLSLLVQFSLDLGWKSLNVKGIYSYNERSIRLFESLGFTRKGEQTGKQGMREFSYTLNLVQLKQNTPFKHERSNECAE